MLTQKQLPGARQLLIAAVVCWCCAPPDAAHGLDHEGFSEPYRTIEVATDATGILDEVLVREGQRVEAGQPLARLNSDVHQALLAIAEQNTKATGPLDAAKATLRLHRNRYDKLLLLRREGHARQEEVDKASSEVAVAEANVRAAREQLLVRELELQKIRAELRRRTIHSPITGTVSQLQKETGEFVASASPDVMTVVELDRLLANFSVAADQIAQLSEGQEVKVHFPAADRMATGVIEYVAAMTDAESGTVLVKVRIENARRQFRSGERCWLRLAE